MMGCLIAVRFDIGSKAKFLSVEDAGVCSGVQIGTCAACDIDITRFQAYLSGYSVKYRNTFLRQFLIMVFFMVSTLLTIEKSAPVLAFLWLIDNRMGVTGTGRQCLAMAGNNRHVTLYLIVQSGRK